MQPYSHDWRVRVMAALERGERRRDVAECFAVSVPTITRWVRRRGNRWAGPEAGAWATRLRLDALRAALPARLTDRADATLAEQCAWWRKQSGVQVSTATMSRALTLLGLDPAKKVAAGLRTAGSGPGWPGARRSPRSGPRTWSSWTRPAATWAPPRRTPEPRVATARRPWHPGIRASTRPWSRPCTLRASGRCAVRWGDHDGVLRRVRPTRARPHAAAGSGRGRR